MSLQTLLCVTVLLYKLTGCLSIMGGRDAQRGVWPWMVHLELRDTRNSSIAYCGGSMVSVQWVLSSSSCFSGRSGPALPERSFACVGELSLLEPSGRKVKLKRVVLHPDYRDDGDIVYNDIALVQLQEAVSFSDTVQPVLLPSPRDQFSPHAECWLTGWGHLEEFTPLGGKKTLQEVQVSLIDEATCRQKYPDKPDSMMCAGDLRGGKDSCTGDAGAPLVCVLAGEVERRFVQVGIVSFGDGCGRVGIPAFYTHVFHHTQFIRDTIQEAECNNLPPSEACFL
ncbi:serine protease 27-like [Sardina pilchardus]|uniref:serine protease 27-like n=1 Tax=Sardina pilchardus TaxID=27697 RepID=UPI002E0FE423